MIPVDILPHPDAPDCYFAMGKPKDWSDEDCGTLTVRRVGATGDMLFEPAARIVWSELPSGEVVYPAFMSEWIPTEEDIARINAGGAVRMLISGNALPPVALWVRGEDEV